VVTPPSVIRSLINVSERDSSLGLYPRVERFLRKVVFLVFSPVLHLLARSVEVVREHRRIPCLQRVLAGFDINLTVIHPFPASRTPSPGALRPPFLVKTVRISDIPGINLRHPSE